MTTFFTRRASRQSGQGMTEYIIIVALIAVAAIGVYSYFGQSLRSQTAAMTEEMAGQKGDTTKATTAATAAGGQTGSKNLSNYTGSQSK
jgi:type IV pilus assembly protein PilA